MSGKIKTMGAGHSGISSRGVNVNAVNIYPIQGIPSTIGVNRVNLKHIKSSAYGSKRDWIFPMNQLAGGVGRTNNSSYDSKTNFDPFKYVIKKQEEEQEEIDELYINFSDYNLSAISDSANNIIQKGWSGGAQKYFQNDSTDNETITTVQKLSNPYSWYTGILTYGNPGQGSPHTPKLKVETNSANANDFNEKLYGSGLVYSLYFRAEATSGNGSMLTIYNGTYDGNDRTGLNVYMECNQATGKIDVYSYTYNLSDNSYPKVYIATGLNLNSWHKFECNISYHESSDPINDIYLYRINNGSPVNIPSWPNIMRKVNNFTLTYGTRLTFKSFSTTGWYIDDIYMKYISN